MCASLCVRGLTGAGVVLCASLWVRGTTAGLMRIRCIRRIVTSNNISQIAETVIVQRVDKNLVTSWASPRYQGHQIPRFGSEGFFAVDFLARDKHQDSLRSQIIEDAAKRVGVLGQTPDYFRERLSNRESVALIHNSVARKNGMSYLYTRRAIIII